jgi:two-component system, OmpR family, sensor histidine kinase MprB
MTFRLRVTAMAALAVAVAVVATSLVAYYSDGHDLVGQVDNDLHATLGQPPLRAVVRGGGPVHMSARGRPGPAAHPRYRVILPDTFTAVSVHLTPRPAGAVPHRAGPTYSTRAVRGVPTRVLTLLVPREAITVSRPLVEVDQNLAHLRWLLSLISLGGVGAAAALGALASGRVVAPLRRLTESAERIAESGDLSRRTNLRGRDEVSRLSVRLDELLAGLERSLQTQRQLVADASHELRTPIAALRANIGLLADPGALDEAERDELLVEVQEELEAVTSLVAELVELARGEEREVTPREFRLDGVVQGAIERAARRRSDITFRAVLEPSTVVGVPERVERAVANLLDNARKWSPPHETVEVTVRDGMVEVRDHGPGIAQEDVPLVFDRFYRAKAARGMPGAGLGLSIVKQIIEAHGGSIAIDPGPDGGVVARLSLHRVVSPASPPL